MSTYRNTFQNQCLQYAGFTGDATHMYLANDLQVGNDLNVINNVSVGGTILGALGITFAAFTPTITTTLGATGSTGFYASFGDIDLAIGTLSITFGGTGTSGDFTASFPTNFFESTPSCTYSVVVDGATGADGSYLTGSAIDDTEFTATIWRPQAQTADAVVLVNYLAIGKKIVIT